MLPCEYATLPQSTVSNKGRSTNHAHSIRLDAGPIQQSCHLPKQRCGLHPGLWKNDEKPECRYVPYGIPATTAKSFLPCEYLRSKKNHRESKSKDPFLRRARSS